MSNRKFIGVLDLQGGVHEHVYHLEALGIEAIRVKEAKQLDNLAGLILPGGESTCLSRLLNIFEIAEPIKKAVADGMKIWGTCAGAILIANQIENEKPHLSLMDINVSRNAFGFQLDSFKTRVSVPKVAKGEIDLTFIRAPKIISVGKNVDPLLTIDQYIAAAESPECLATVFHPELTPSLAFHKYFVQKCGIEVTSTLSERPERTSWMKFAQIANPVK
jgi:5'-phosphate synthase pdxT subunit